MDRDFELGPDNPPLWLPIVMLSSVAFWTGILIWIFS